jgi:hypothetical protein
MPYFKGNTGFVLTGNGGTTDLDLYHMLRKSKDNTQKLNTDSKQLQHAS